MTCPRCAFAALLFCLLAFFGCDSNNPGGDVSEFEGTYGFTTYLFSRSGDDPDVNVVNRLDPGYDNQLEIDGSGTALIRYRRINASSRLVTLDARASGGILVLTPVTSDGADNLIRELLFPPDGSLRLEKAGDALTSVPANLTVNLYEFDPEAFPSAQNYSEVEGTLAVAFSRN